MARGKLCSPIFTNRYFISIYRSSMYSYPLSHCTVTPRSILSCFWMNEIYPNPRLGLPIWKLFWKHLGWKHFRCYASVIYKSGLDTESKLNASGLCHPNSPWVHSAVSQRRSWSIAQLNETSASTCPSLSGPHFKLSNVCSFLLFCSHSSFSLLSLSLFPAHSFVLF